RDPHGNFSFEPAERGGIFYIHRFGGKFPVCQLRGKSRLHFEGIEEIAVKIDWSQGPQAVRRAWEKWFQQHKKELLRLKSDDKLSMIGDSFQLRDPTGTENPRRKYVTALRGLGGMRLLSRYTLLKAIEKSKGSGRVLSKTTGERDSL